MSQGRRLGLRDWQRPSSNFSCRAAGGGGVDRVDQAPALNYTFEAESRALPGGPVCKSDPGEASFPGGSRGGTSIRLTGPTGAGGTSGRDVGEG